MNLTSKFGFEEWGLEWCSSSSPWELCFLSPYAFTSQLVRPLPCGSQTFSFSCLRLKSQDCFSAILHYCSEPTCLPLLNRIIPSPPKDIHFLLCLPPSCSNEHHHMAGCTSPGTSSLVPCLPILTSLNKCSNCSQIKHPKIQMWSIS